MAKLSFVVALALLGVALGTTVCIPTPNWVEVQTWTSNEDGYTAQYQYLDVAGNRYRATDLEFFNIHGRDRQFVQDTLVLAAENKAYIVDGNPRIPSSLKCRVVAANGAIKDPCLSYNASKISTDYIGVDKVDNYFTQDDHHGVTVYGRLLFTQSGIPVNFATWNQMGHSEQLFVNFNQTLPTNAFQVPSICGNAQQVEMGTSEFIKTFKLEGKFAAN